MKKEMKQTDKALDLAYQVTGKIDIGSPNTKEEIVQASQPILFMGSTITNIPNPITIPASVVSGLPHRDEKDIRLLLFLLRKESINSFTNIILNCLWETVYHIVCGSDVFIQNNSATIEAAKATLLASVTETLRFNNIYGFVSNMMGSLNYIPSDYIKDMNQIMEEFDQQRIPIHSELMIIFGEFQNEIADRLSSEMFHNPNIDPSELINVKSYILNSAGKYCTITDIDQNFIHGVFLSMMYNYALGFGGVATFEIDRLRNRHISVLGVSNSEKKVIPMNPPIFD